MVSGEISSCPGSSGSQLEDQTSPDWLGLPNNAERVLLAQRGHDLVIKLLKMQQLDEDDEELAYRLVTVKIV